MTHQFSQAPQAEIQRSRFNRSHGHKTTFDAGWLVPIFLDEVLPGDTFNLRMQGFARLATPIDPIMDNMFMETFFFFVPTRLVWENWAKFNGEQENPGDSTDYTIPQVTYDAAGVPGKIIDYFGLPVDFTGSLSVNSLPFRCYNLIFNEWFRDQNLRNSRTVPKGDTGDTVGLTQMLRRSKRHDYFTSCLPWPQKGEAVELPLGQDAPVKGLGRATGANDYPSSRTVRELDGERNYDHAFDVGNAGLDEVYLEGTSAIGYPNLRVDLSEATAATINELRQAFQIQRMLERDARGGTRYTEIIRSHFGVISPDARLQRPEFLGGGSSRVNINPVPQTSSTDATTPQGNLSAYGTASLNNHGFTKSFTEHGFIIGLVNVRADLTYQQGLNRLWSRLTRFDHYWPALAHIGEQAVLSKEIYTDGSAADDSIFGYQERYAEYRYKPSMITGLFRSSSNKGLDTWHLSQDFADRPVLDQTFIEDNPPIDRVIAVPDEPHFLFDSYFNLNCARPMPLYGVPGYIDHF